MADGLSLTASIIAVIQLTAQAAVLDYDYTKGVVEALSDISKLMNELKSFSGVLTILQDSVQ